MTLYYPHVIALDAGGTEIKAGLLRGDEIIATRRWSTQRELGGDHARDQILLAAKEMTALHPEAEAIGLVVPGVVDVENGIAVFSENIKWENVPFKSIIHHVTNLPVGFGHDVRAGGVAENTFGAGRGFKNSLFLPIGTGIAGAITINGEMFEDVFSGEIGHMDVVSGYKCECGARDCLESISTGPSIARIYTVKSGKSAINSEQVLMLANEGDVIAQQVWQDAMMALAKAVYGYITVLAPEVIIFGGGLSRAGNQMIEPIRDHLSMKITFQRKPELKIAELGDSAGMIGAGILASRVILTRR